MWDHDRVKSDDLLGTVDIPLFKLKSGEVYNQWQAAPPTPHPTPNLDNERGGGGGCAPISPI